MKEIKKFVLKIQIFTDPKELLPKIINEEKDTYPVPKYKETYRTLKKQQQLIPYKIHHITPLRFFFYKGRGPKQQKITTSTTINKL